MKFDLKNVEFSKVDKQRNLKLPLFLDSKLAEDVGIQIGDGCISRGEKDYIINCSFNATEDLQYIQDFVVPLKAKLFKNANLIVSKVGGEARIKIGSKAIFDFYTKIIGLPAGSKDEVEIPKIIFKNRDYLVSCVRGIIDTDFSLSFKKRHKQVHYYPVISANFKSKKLVKQLELIFNKLGFKVHTEFDYERFDKRFGKVTTHYIYLNGKNNLGKWWEIIGSNNHRLITKYKIFKKSGSCPPKTNVKERFEILNGK